MTYDVPLPPCVERRRGRHVTGDTERHEIVWGIWRHCTDEAERGGCLRCFDDATWDLTHQGGPTLDIGRYADEAGHRLVNLGLEPRTHVMTAREIAEDTERAFLKGKK